MNRLLCSFLALIVWTLPGSAQIAGRNVNMVSGTKWPEGDPFLQRQNEPSLAVSSRNPSHLLAGSNDYRTVDLPGLPAQETGDAWLGIFKSYDGGQTWRSTVHPGCPQAISACDGAPALKNYTAAADPVVRAGTNGMFYYSGIAFTRESAKRSVVFVSRFIDNNNEENGDPIQFAGATPVASAIMAPFNSGSAFIDKPWIAVDIPRAGAQMCEINTTRRDGTLFTQTFPGGNVYLAWTNFIDETKPPSQIMFARSLDCGATWSKPAAVADNALNQGANLTIDPATGAVYLTWRRFKSTGLTDAVMFAESRDGGATFSTPIVVAEITPFDQGTTSFSFRTNAYPTMTVDGAGRVYIAWSERNAGAAESGGDARIVITTSRDRQSWTKRKPVSDYAGRGHQFMPAMAFGGGKVAVVFYDARQDSTVANYDAAPGGLYTEKRAAVGDLASTPPLPQKVFTSFLLDASPSAELGPLKRRHTIDVFSAQADPGDAPVFSTTRVSQYIFGSRQNETLIEQLQVNPPNLPLFKQGQAPFLGDYLDIAPSPSFVPGTGPGTWKFNTEPSSSSTFHAVWADNRDVRPPANGDWTDYTPPISPSSSGLSIFDPTQPQPACRTGQAGMRNQNIYTSRITQGLLVGSPANTKVLGKYQRSFPINVSNTTNRNRSYRLTILNQPQGGRASFLQTRAPGLPDPFVVLDLNVPAGSTSSRMVFVNSTDPRAQVRVAVDEINAPGGSLVPGGLAGSIALNPDPLNPDIANPDIANPDIANPDIFNPDIANPDIANPDIANPDIANPDIANPDIANPDIANPDIANPDIANPDIANPDIANPDIANPDIANPDIANTAVSDVTWKLTNKGNAAASYAVDLLLNGKLPGYVRTQLLVHRLYTNPVAIGCSLVEQPQKVMVANIVDPRLLTQQAASRIRQLILAQARPVGEARSAQTAAPEITDNADENATVTVGPGETVYITVRFYNLDKSQGLGFDPSQDLTVFTVSLATNSDGTLAVAASHLIVATTDIPTASVGAAYNQTLVAAGGKQPYQWSLVSGNLPPGLSLSESGQITGMVPPGTPSNLYRFTVQVNDSSSPAVAPVRQELTIQVSTVVLAITSIVAQGPAGGRVLPGDTVTVSVTVANSGTPAASVVPGLDLLVTGTATTNCGSPTPSAGSLGMGTDATFVFTCTGVSGVGTLSFSAALTAVDTLTGAGIRSASVTSNSLTVLNPVPVIAASATSQGAPYSPGAWTPSDVEVTFTCTPANGAPVVKIVTASAEGANQAVAFTCTDQAGNQGTSTFSGINIDKTPPKVTVSATADGLPVFDGYTSQTVVVTFTCTDPGGSGVTSPGSQQTLSNEGLGQYARYICTDLAGNTATGEFGPVNIVRTQPGLTATYASGAGAYNPGTWSRDAVTVTFQCQPTAGNTVQTVTGPITVGGEGANQFVKGSCTDAAGNMIEINAGPINVDRTPPTITLNSLPPANAAGWYSADVTVVWQCADNIAPASSVTRKVTSEGAGQAIAGSCTDLAGNTASSSVNISLDKTAPAISVSATAGGQPFTGGSTAQNVVVTFTCTDPNGSGATQGAFQQTFSTPGAGQVAKQTCTDLAGNTSSGQFGPFEISRLPVALTAAYSANGAPYTPGAWSKEPVTVTFTCQPATGLTVVQVTAPVTIGADGANQSVTGACTDSVGTQTQITAGPINVDRTAPVMTLSSLPPANAAGWYKTAVTAVWQCADNLAPASTVTSTAATEGAGQSLSGSCTDLAGNTASASVTVNIDKTAPGVSASATAGGQPFAGGSTAQNVIVTFACADAGGSGVTQASFQQTFSSAGVGQTATQTCTDIAGNTSQGQFGPFDIVRPAPVLSVSYSGGYTAGSWTKNPVTVTFSCQPGAGLTVQQVTAPVTVSTEGANQTATGTCTDSVGTQAQITSGPINIDQTAPVMTLSNLPPANAAGWYSTDVTVVWQCADNLAGTSNVSRTVTTEGAGQVVSGSCSDLAGNSTSASVTVKIDKTAPSLTSSVLPAAPASGWYTVPVAVSFSCTDGLSGVAAGFPTGNTTLNTDTNGTTVAGQCRDVAGNTSNASAGPVRIDTTAPVPQFQSASGINGAGWAKGPVTVTWACSDTGSGPVAPVITHTLNATGTDPVTCTDIAGNSGSATSALIRIDSVAPNVNLISPFANATYSLNQNVLATYLCSDNASGVASCTGNVASGAKIDTTVAGTFTFTVTAIDVAGNQNSVSRTYKVQ